jgi:hypothetical protein
VGHSLNVLLAKCEHKYYYTFYVAGNLKEPQDTPITFGSVIAMKHSMFIHAVELLAKLITILGTAALDFNKLTDARFLLVFLPNLNPVFLL